jgi:hypothetical protein
MAKIRIEDIKRELDNLNETLEKDDLSKNEDPNSDREINGVLESCRINVSDKIPEPEICLEIVTSREKSPIATLGNFSAIIGKAKSKKTFLISMAISSAMRREIFMEKFNSSLPEGKENVLFFDTEQSRYHVQKVVRRICLLSEINKPENLKCFALRPMDTKTRVELIEYALDTIEGVGLVVIDGIRDLVMDINDPREATTIVTKLMQWTETKGIHIMTALHQNKGDTNARGHLGTEIINKAETIISVTKDTGDPLMSIVEAEYIREKEFSPFAFRISTNGLPSVVNDWVPPKDGKKTISPFNYPPESHYKILNDIFKRNPSPGYSDMWRDIKHEWASLYIQIGDNKAKEFLKYYESAGMVIKKGEGKSKSYSLK